MNRQIMVGYDGSTHADEALAWAASAARRQHAPLRIVHVARTFLEVLFYRLVVRPVRDPSFAPAWVEACAGWLDRQDTTS